jgi:3-deoxy-D-manno-octulosonate 8-phosphate phosphatase (KDO 8-P phosphatase)
MSQSAAPVVEPTDDVKSIACNIELVIFDIDGVFTDGGLYRSDDGQETKRFHATDGLGIRMLADAGVTLGVITGRTSKVVEHRCKELQIEHVYQGQKDKLGAFETLAAKLDLQHAQIAYMGDDIIDMPVMKRAGLALTVPGACAEIADMAHWTSQRRGGNGAVREACELLLKSKNLYEKAIARYMV